MGRVRSAPVWAALCLALAVTAPAAPHASGAPQNSVRARYGAPPRTTSNRDAAKVATPPGAQELRLDDGTSEYSVGVTDDLGEIGSQAVYLNRFVPPADQLPITIDSVSFLFPTSDEFGDTGLFSQQTFQALVYLDEDDSRNPADAVLVQRVTFDLEPSNSVFQTVTLDEPVNVSRGSVLIGFTDPYVAVTNEPIYPAAVDANTLSNSSLVFHNLTPGHHFDGEHLDQAENGGFIFPDGTFIIRAFYTTGGAVSVCWNPASGDGAPPTNNRICTSTAGRKCRECGVHAKAAGGGSPIGYKIYRSTSPNVQPTQANLYTSVPPTVTTVDSGVAPGGTFFVITAVYSDGESAPSNEAGAKPATVTSVKVKATKLNAKGTDFTNTVQVFVDGIPFVSQAKVKGGKKVNQKGNLITGLSLGDYFAVHGSARIAFRNSDGTMTTVTARR